MCDHYYQLDSTSVFKIKTGENVFMKFIDGAMDYLSRSETLQPKGVFSV